MCDIETKMTDCRVIAIAEYKARLEVVVVEDTNKTRIRWEDAE